MSFELNLTRIADALESIAQSLAKPSFVVPDSGPAVEPPSFTAPDSGPVVEPPKEKKPRAKKADAAPAPTMPAEVPSGRLQAANPNPAGIGTFAAIAPISPAAHAALPAVKQEALTVLQQAQAAAAAKAVPLEPTVLAAVAPAPLPSFTPPAAPAFSGYDSVLSQYPGALLPSQILDAETMANLGKWDTAFSAADPAQQMLAVSALVMEFIGDASVREALSRALSWFGQALPISKGAAAPNEPGDAWLAMPVNQRFIVYVQTYLAAAKLRAAQPAGV